MVRDLRRLHSGFHGKHCNINGGLSRLVRKAVFLYGGAEKKGGLYMYKIFIVEDDDIIAGALKKNFETWGYAVSKAEDLKNVIAEFVREEPQLVLMDIGLPFFNGYHWCSEIRKLSKVPVMFISSASDNMNIVMAMNMGGDDFVQKPFDLAVITAKVQALLRRTYDFSSQAATYIEHGGAILDTSDATLIVNGEKTDLSKNEYRILQILMERHGVTVSREELMERLWETDCYVDENALTVNITRLRKKLASSGLEDFICTKRGFGYYIE